MTYVREFEEGISFLEHLDGVAWLDAHAPPRKHECWAQTRGIMEGMYVERCACGAFGPAPFFMLGRDEPRVMEEPRWWERLRRSVAA